MGRQICNRRRAARFEIPVFSTEIIDVLAMDPHHRSGKHSNESDQWYGLARWKKRRKAQLRVHPLCKLCLDRALVVPARVVDHVEPHHGDRHKFEYGALQSLCVPCHDSIKATIEARGYSIEIGLDGWPVDPNHPAWQGRQLNGRRRNRT